LADCYWKEEKNLKKAQQYFSLSLDKNREQKDSFNSFIKFHKETGLFPDPKLLLRVPHFFQDELQLLRYITRTVLSTAAIREENNASSVYE